MFPDVLFDSESSKETESKELGLSFSSHDESSTKDVPDVPLDSGSSKENQIKDINTTRVDSEVASERESKKDEEETDSL